MGSNAEVKIMWHSSSKWRKGTFLTTAAFASALVVTNALADDPPFSDDMEAYTVGQPLTTQSTEWEPWCFPTGPDGAISNAFAHSGTKSYYETFADGTSDDTVHPIVATSGCWEVSTWVYHNSADATQGPTWFIVLNTYGDQSEACGGTNNWSCQVVMDSALGTVTDLNFGANAGGTHSTQSLVYDAWVQVRLDVDLDNDLASVYYNGLPVHTNYVWTEGASGAGQLAMEALDLYIQNGAIYWDDVVVEGGACGGGPVCADTSVWSNHSSTSGSAANTCGSDNAYYAGRREAFTPNASRLLTNTLTFDANGLGAGGGLSYVAEVSIDNAGVTNVRARLVLVNQVGGANASILSAPLTTTDTVVTLNVANGADFIDANGFVTAQVVYVQTSGGPNWNGRIDDSTLISQ